MSSVNIKNTIDRMLPHFLRRGLIASLFSAVATGIQTLVDKVGEIYNGALVWNSRTSSPYSGIYYELAHNSQKNSMQAYLNDYFRDKTANGTLPIWVKDNVDNLTPLYIHDDASVAINPGLYGRYVYQPDYAGDAMLVYAPEDYIDVAQGYNFIISIPRNWYTAADKAAVKHKVDSLKIDGTKYAIVER